MRNPSCLFGFVGLLIFPCALYASFIEVTQGTAVVNDATAAYHNPAALTLLKNPQMIALGSTAFFHSHFSGQVEQTATGYIQHGATSNTTRYHLPSLYMSMPVNDRVDVGLAVILNFFNSSVDDHSILRYAKSSSNMDNIDIVPAIGAKVTDYFSVGAAMTYSVVDLQTKPVFGFPALNIPDSQSKNNADGHGVGADIGFLLKPTATTRVGFNYRTSVRYDLGGNSQLQVNPPLTSHHYQFSIWTPARAVLSVSQALNTQFGLIATVQRIQWNILQNIHIENAAIQKGKTPAIVNATVPYYLHNSWLLTIGGQYWITPRWVARAAASFVQSPGNASYQLANGNSKVLGVSMGYEINKTITIDGSYAHVFMNDEPIHITQRPTMVSGINTGHRDGFSLKLTLNA